MSIPIEDSNGSYKSSPGKKKILLVEQDNALRKIYEDRLKIEGFNLMSLNNVEDALVKTVEFNPDLIITEILLPEISGLDLIDIIRNTPETSQIPIVVLTNLQPKEFEIRARDLGATDYLVKSRTPIAYVVANIRGHLGLQLSESERELINQRVKEVDIEKGHDNKTIDISKINSSFGGDNEPEDKHLSKLLGRAYRGDIMCRRAIIPLDMIKPYSDFMPEINENYQKYFLKKYEAMKPPDLFVYKMGNKFIMSDDYNAYYMYKSVEALNAICVVIGDDGSTEDDGIEYGPPFMLSPPTIEISEQ